MNREINSNILADLLNIKPKPGSFIQRLKHDMKDNNFNMDDQIILIKNDTLDNPFQNSFEEETESSSMPMSLPLPMIYQEQEPSSVSMSTPMSMPMMYQDQIQSQQQEPLTCNENKMSENELIMQQQELIRQQQELITQQQEQLNIYKIKNMITNNNNNNHNNHATHNNHHNHNTHKKHKKTVRFQLIPFHKKMSRRKTRRATPLPRRSSSFSPKLLKL